jgi:hypothetical protein
MFFNFNKTTMNKSRISELEITPYNFKEASKIALKDIARDNEVSKQLFTEETEQFNMLLQIAQ